MRFSNTSYQIKIEFSKHQLLNYPTIQTTPTMQILQAIQCSLCGKRSPSGGFGIYLGLGYCCFFIQRNESSIDLFMRNEQHSPRGLTKYTAVVELPQGSKNDEKQLVERKAKCLASIPAGARQMSTKRRINHYFNVVSRCMDLPDELLAFIATACV
jgi:hypothetical protein